MQIKFYEKSNGRIPVKDEISKLDNVVKAEIVACLKNVEVRGLDANGVEFRQIDGKLWEIKLKTRGGGYRIFYTMLVVDVMVLLHIYKKETQKAPKKEIEIAIKRMKDILNNK